MSSQSNPFDRKAEKKQPQSVKQLLSEIKLALEDGDFEEAERLRDKLIETDPMAISEAIIAAELIEKEMSAEINKEHLAIWPELYDQLTIEERNCLFHSMKLYILPANRMLLKYGTLNNRLFFIEKGSVAVVIPRGENKFKVLAQLGPGDILGEYTFATMALCSATAVTKTAVQIRCLDGKKAESWEEKHPGLHGKLLEFCRKCGRVDLISERKAQESHTYPRYSIDGHVKAILLDKNDQKTEVNFNGELEEISRSGTSFSIHCNTKKMVKQLLTRSFFLDFTCNNKGKEISFSTVGKVVRISFLLYNDYLLHIGFHTSLPENLDAQLQQALF
ncbi:cyclic nucleotide-binding domain-containing protein [Rhodoferax sp. 4810]|nr:cyclic nucleotide-binding domain-containing protein [Rhodoferax jenense]